MSEQGRKTVFCTSNPYKEMNPVRHIEKRSVDQIIGFLNAESVSTVQHSSQQQQHQCSEQSRKSVTERYGRTKPAYYSGSPDKKRPAILNNNNQSFQYNNQGCSTSISNSNSNNGKENNINNNGGNNCCNSSRNHSAAGGKRVFDEKRKENFFGANNVTSVPAQEKSIPLPKPKGTGEFNIGRNIQSHVLEAQFGVLPGHQQKVSKKKPIEGIRLNNESITTELAKHASLGSENQCNVTESKVTQKKQIPPRKASVGECFNDYVIPQYSSVFYLESNSLANHRNSSQNQRNMLERMTERATSVATRSNSTTTAAAVAIDKTVKNNNQKESINASNMNSVKLTAIGNNNRRGSTLNQSSQPIKSQQQQSESYQKYVQSQPQQQFPLPRRQRNSSIDNVARVQSHREPVYKYPYTPCRLLR